MNIILERIKNATYEEKKEICKHLKISHDNINDLEILKIYEDAANHTFNNIIKKNKNSYKDVLVNIIKKIRVKERRKIKIDNSFSVIDLENELMQNFIIQVDTMKKKWDKLPEEKKEKKLKQVRKELSKLGYKDNIINSSISIFTSTTASLIGATPITLSLFYSSFWASSYAYIFGVSTLTMGMVGASVFSILALPALFIILGSPAYRKIIPVTLLLIKIRERIEIEKELK
ncbi:hypothetical protein ACH5BF_07850 [Arcobacter sp. YIC-464]|uniref:hypothetical protein n=1 Tax=Arcobacter sp. YIC-464 TaxID=3376631 RepID=UPI003C1EB5E4